MKKSRKVEPATTTRSETDSEIADSTGPIVDEQIVRLALLDEQRFAIGGERARGGIGRVFEATDRLLGRAVALKQPQAQDRPGAVARFMREALITARLQHPAIVPIYDVG